MPLASGQVFAGFTTVRLVGTGGMGEVYLAKHPRLPREDALKVLPISVSADDEFRQRFIREADMAATLWHPHIVGVHDRGEFEGRLWISMDYVDGHDAARLLHDKYPKGMPADDVVEIVTAVGDALDYAHQRQLLHRDVKPANILVTEKHGTKRRIMLTDFGIARRTDDVNGLTSTNITVGSMSYTSPEQLMGQPLDGRADQYSLAATAYRLLTGAPPFSHSNPAVVISHHLNSPPPKLGDTKPALAKLDSVMAKALAKDAKDRFDTCHDFAVALAEANKGDESAAPVTAAPPPVITPPVQTAPPTTPLKAQTLPAPPTPPTPLSPSNPQAPTASQPPVFTSSWAGHDDPSGRQPVAVPAPAPPPPPPPSNFGPPPPAYSPPPRKSGGDRRKLIIAAAAIGAVVLLVGGITLAVTSGGDNDSAGAAATTSETASETPVTTTPKKPGEHAYTIADYIRDNKISETPVHRGDPNTPELTMPTPPGWADAGTRTPAWAYSAIVNDPASPTDPPSVISLISKLDGNVDPEKLLEFAPNELQNLTEWEPIGGVTRSNLSGFPSVQLGGSYLKDGKRRAITQKTVVVDIPSGIYVLQINADSLYRDFGALVDVNKAIDKEATIKP